jgi:SRSO17 transposase
MGVVEAERLRDDLTGVKTGLGLDHYEGRSWQGWHHHATLVSAAHAFLTLQRLDPSRNDPLRGTPTPAEAARPPDRHLPRLPNPLPATETTTPPKVTTKHY